LIEVQQCLYASLAINSLTPDLHVNPSAQCCLARYFPGILIFKWLTARRLYKSFGVKGLTPELNPSAQRCLPRFLPGILIFKGLTARRLYKSFGVKGLS
jgi:hypothetical protein